MEMFYYFIESLARYAGLIMMIVVWGIVMPIMFRRQRGPMLRDKYSVPFLKSHLREYQMAKWDSNLLIHDGKDFTVATEYYIQRDRMGFLSQWRIRNIGRVPRFSKAERMLNSYHGELKYKI
jgi:hypothetical protein